MEKKSRKLNNEKNEKRLRIIFRFLIIASVMVLIAGAFLVLNSFATNLYTAFILNFIGSFFLFATFMTICSFILYSIFVITIFNPQKIKKSSVIKFAFGGIFTLIITIFLLIFGVTEAEKSIQDIKDYTNSKWEVKDLLVTDVYRGSRYHRMSPIRPSRMILIETSEGEMTLFFEDFRIHEGEKYRFTYLDATKTIINVEKIVD